MLLFPADDTPPAMVKLQQVVLRKIGEMGPTIEIYRLYIFDKSYHQFPIFNFSLLDAGKKCINNVYIQAYE